jgi:hypothetical protein
MQCVCNSWSVRNLVAMVLRLNKFPLYGVLISTPDCSGPASTFVPFDSEYSATCVSSTIPE